MNKSENTLRNLVALAAAACIGAMVLFALTVGYLSVVNTRLRRDNQEMRAMITRLSEQPTPAVVANVPIINVHISGVNNAVKFAPTETGGAIGDVNVDGSNGTTMIYLGAGQTAQATVIGTNNYIYIASALTGRVSCTNSGSNNGVIFSP